MFMQSVYAILNLGRIAKAIVFGGSHTEHMSLLSFTKSNRRSIILDIPYDL